MLTIGTGVIIHVYMREETSHQHSEDLVTMPLIADHADGQQCFWVFLLYPGNYNQLLDILYPLALDCINNC